MNKKIAGFTIVELIIVITVIGILASITIVSYNGVQQRARNVKAQSDLKSVSELVESYAAKNGSYPSTGSLTFANTDPACGWGTKIAAWVPGLPTDVVLPTSADAANTGVGGKGGCYMYASDGTNYVISAWNMASGAPKSDILYRRVGFREMGLTQYYICNHPNIGGRASGTYVATEDYYKYSYTVSNIKTCVETPPAGA